LLFCGFCLFGFGYKIKLNKNFFVLLLTLMAYLLSFIWVRSINTSLFLHNFIINCVFIIIVLCYKLNYKLVMKQCVIGASVMLLLIELMLITNNSAINDYMTFGFNFFIAFSLLLIYCYKKGIKWAVLISLLFLPQLLVYSSRAVWYMVAVLLIILLYGYSKRKWIKVVGTIGIVGFLLNFNLILNTILNFLSQNISDTTYSIRNIKAILQSQQLLGPREHFYQLAWSTIRENPITGVGIGGFEDNYPHNIVLDLWVTFGVFLGTALLIYIIYIAAKALKTNTETTFTVLFCWIIVNALRMLTSHTFVCEPMFFMVICMGINGIADGRKNDFCYNTDIQ